MDLVKAAARRLIDGLAVLGVLAYGIAALVTVADVIGRRFGLPITGVVDLVQLFVVTGAWLVMPFAFAAATHVSVDLLLTNAPRVVQLPLALMSAVLAFGLVALMLWQGYLTFETRTMFGDRSQQLGIPIAWYWYPLLLGLVVSLIAIPLSLFANTASETPDE